MNDYDWIIEQHYTMKKTLKEIAIELGVTPSTIGRYCTQHNIPVRIYYSSISEKEITSYIKSLGYDVIQNDRTLIHPYEIMHHLLILENTGKCGIMVCLKNNGFSL